ncbi:MAG: aminotransferase class III-fold pyridoxal phosphate-dependent enzyme, partial [Ilumatobacteraceae bacterium]
VERSSPPEQGFLEGVRSLTRLHGAVLIFDECTSGFRRAMGGLHLDYGVEPDLATFGKTLGNGYAISAVIGSEAVMSAASKTFISSTFWTERIGSAAALAALEAMQSEQAPAAVDQIGRQIREIWKVVAAGNSLDVRFDGLPALTSVTVEGWNAQEFKERLVTGMLAEGFLAGTAVYASTAHTPEILERYGEALGRVLGVIQVDPPVDDPQMRASSATHRGFGRLA